MVEIKVVPVGAAYFIAHWKEIEPMLDKAMPVMLRRFEPIDILSMMIGNPQLIQGWAALEGETILAAMVTQIIQYPRARSLSMFCLAGTRMKDWFKTGYDLLLEYGARMGATQFEVVGRKGWEKVLDLVPRGTILITDIKPPA